MTVTLGVDPHKGSHTVVATDQVGRQLTQTTTRGTRTSDHKELIGGRRAAPLECSSGAWQRHRLSRVGNRQLNAALDRIAVTELRVDPPAQAYLTRLQAAGKSKREALRVLKRRLVRVVFNLLQADLPQARLAPSAAPLPAHEPAA